MKKIYKTNNSRFSKLPIHGSFLFLFLSLFFIVMIIPTIIVYGAGHVYETFNRSSYNQSSSSISQQQEAASLTLGWISGNNSNINHLTDYKNLNIVSPALATINNQFDLQVAAQSSNTNNIQSQGKKVWARIIMNNDTKTNVHTFLANNKKVRELSKIIRQTAITNNWDGINLDIENISGGDREALSQFIKYLSDELNKTSISLSIDLPPDPNGNNNTASPFDHKIIGKYCNYIVFMGYDQHWSTDPVPGPVTSLSWLKQNVQEFIQTGISPNKLILGLPAYTRIWEQNQQGQIVKDPAEPIQYVQSLVTKNHRNLAWDSALGEYFTSYNVNNVQYKIWLPTEKSFNIYLNLINQFHLAGSAVWNLNLMETDYWNQIYS